MNPFIALIIVLGFACTPPGTPSRLIQTPYQAKEEQSPQVSVTAKPIMERGLPESCDTFSKLQQGAQNCIRCRKNLEIIRCLNTIKSIQPENQCKFSQEKVKCLVGKATINLSLEKPQEKIFQKQLQFLLQVLSSITTDKLQNELLKRKLNMLLNALAKNPENFFEESRQSLLVSSLNQIAGGKHEKIFLKIFKKLDTKRVQGELDSESSKIFIADILSQFPELYVVENILNELNTQGIDTP